MSAAGPMSTSLRVNWTILRICIEERLIYRADFAFATLVRFLPIVTQIFLWGAIFGIHSSTPREELNSYTYPDMVAYYLFAMVGRAFSSMPGLGTGIAEQVRSGEIKKFLVQPVDLLGFLLLNRVAHKLVYYLIALGPFVLVFYLCRGYFHGWPDAVTLGAYVLSLALAFLLGFFLEATIGMIAFWWLEVQSLMFVYMLMNYFFSGHMFPLDILPEPWQTLVRWLPLQYTAYFPTAVFLGKVQGQALLEGLGIQLLWVLLFFVLCRLALIRGVRHYSGFGG